MTFLAKTWALTAKDLRIELRGRDTLIPMLAFSLAVVLLLSFTIPAAQGLAAPVALPLGTAPLADVLAGFLWVTVLFAGLIAFARTFAVEEEGAALDSLLLAPLDRSGLFLSKALSNLAFILLVECLLVPLLLVLFGVGGIQWGWLILVVLLADIGFVAIGTLFSVIASQTTARDLVLPVIALPALIPVFLAAVELTSRMLVGQEVAGSGWFVILIGFDVVFAVAGALAFDLAVD